MGPPSRSQGEVEVSDTIYPALESNYGEAAVQFVLDTITQHKKTHYVTACVDSSWDMSVMTKGLCRFPPHSDGKR